MGLCGKFLMPEMLLWDTEAQETIPVRDRNFKKFIILLLKVFLLVLIHLDSFSHPRSSCISVIDQDLYIVYISADYNCSVFVSLLR